MLKRFFYVSITLSLLACSTVNSFLSQSTRGDLDAEEQAVYAALLSNYDVRERVVLSKTTDSGFEFTGQTEQPEGMPGLSQELWEDYLAHNDKTYALSQGMEVGVEYVLLDAREMSDIFSNHEDGWNEFYSRYPDSPGITTFSKVSFNPDRTEALVYMGAQFHYLAGSGNLVRLEKQDGVWKIMDEMMLWIS